MKLKLDDKQQVVVVEGKPVYVYGDGKEVAFDAPGAVAKIAELNTEAKTHREGKESAEAKLKLFDGIEDVDAARAAIKTVKNLDDKKLVEAGKVEEIKMEAIKATEAKFAPTVQKAADLEAKLHRTMIGGAFLRSAFVKDKLVIPADLVEAQFGKAFKLVGDNVVGFGPNGKEVFSRIKPGEVADFEEALEIIIDQYPHKAAILKGKTGSGGGKPPGEGGDAGSKTITRNDFDKLDPATRATRMREGFAVTD